jgi:predicted DNA-binding transcriptional regulator YafY
MNGTRQVTRQLDILRTLHARHYGVRPTELAGEFGVSERTIQRDLRDLALAGFPLYSERQGGSHVFWHLQVTSDLPALTFPLFELASLLFLEDMAEPLEGTPFKSDLHAALRRIGTSLPSPIRGFMHRVAELYAPFVRGRKSYEGSGPIIEDLNQAMLDHKVCRVTYLAPGRDAPKTYRIEPLRVFYFRGGLYLICRVPAHDQLITQAVDRIKALEVTQDTFEPPQDSAVEERLSHSFGVFYEEPFDVAILFSPAQAPYIRERVWHPSQRIEEREDGSLVLRLHVGGQYELKAWILSHGATAQVLEPEFLRQQVAAELQANLQAYQTP